MLRTKYFIVALIFLSILTGCASKEVQKRPVSTKDSLVKAVENYNQTLIKVMNNGNSELLKSVAVEKEVQRVQLFLSALNEEHKRMTAKLLTFQVKTVETHTKQKPPKSTLVDVAGNPVVSDVYADKRAYSLVQTEELWEHQNFDQATGQAVGAPFKLHYVVKYWIEKINGKWLVSDLQFEEKPVK